MDIKKLFRLSTHVWLAGFVNIIALTLQLFELILSKNSGGLSIHMCIGTVYIQFVYARLGQR